MQYYLNDYNFSVVWKELKVTWHLMPNEAVSDY